MRVKFDINGKSLLAVAILSAGIAFGDFVSIADVKTSGGIVVDGMSDEEVKNIILETMPVGSVTLRMDAVNPSTIYGGTWTLITGDAALAFGDGTALNGVSEGNNNPLVPVVAHTHTATQVAHSHTRGTMEIKGTTAIGEFDSKKQTGAFTGKSSYSNEGNGTAAGGSTDYTTNFQASRSWTGSTSSITPKITVASTGTSKATIDVRGARIKVNVWKRTK